MAAPHCWRPLVLVGGGGHLGLNLIQFSRGFEKHGNRRIGLLLRALPLETDLALVSVLAQES